MPDPITSTAIVKASGDILKVVLTPAMKGMSTLVAKKLQLDEARVSKAILEGTERLAAHAARTTTLYSPGEPVNLQDVFVPPDLEKDSVDVGPAVLATFRNLPRQSLVLATAGAGKSTILRQLYLELLQEPSEFPLFIELRRLNNRKTDLYEYILSTFGLPNEQDRRKALANVISASYTWILLDAYDELDTDERNVLDESLAHLISPNSKVRIILTSRPDARVNSLSAFSHYHLKGLTVPQMRELANKTAGTSDANSRIQEQLDDRAFVERYEDFLTVPLLFLIMMLMYRRNVIIPEQIHEFFEEAFITLLRRHDYEVKGFDRPIRSGLGTRQFRLLVAAYAIGGHMNGDYELARSRFESKIDLCLKEIQVEAPVTKVEYDLLTAVCILKLESGLFSFVHRAFQDFFSAVFLIESSFESTREEVLNDIELDGRHAFLLQLLLLLNPKIYYYEWLLPMMERQVKAYGSPWEPYLIQKKEPMDWLEEEYIAQHIASCELVYRNERIHWAPSRLTLLWEMCCELGLLAKDNRKISDFQLQLRTACRSWLDLQNKGKKDEDKRRGMTLKDMWSDTDISKLLLTSPQFGAPVILDLAKLHDRLKRESQAISRPNSKLLGR